MRGASIILLAAAMAAGGCRDAVGPEAGGEASTLAFSYQGWEENGTISGSYRVEGDPVAGVELARQTYAIGQRVRGTGTVVALSGQHHSDGSRDFLSINVPRQTPGSVTLLPGCGGSNCPEVLIAFDAGEGSAAQAQHSCSLRTGTLRILAISDTRVTGEFSGTGACIGRAGVEDIEQFNVIDGRFNLKLSDVQG